MAYTRTQTIANTPNTGTPFSQQTSFQEDLFDSIAAHGGGEMGVGSFKVRSVDDIIVEYEPANTLTLVGKPATATVVLPSKLTTLNLHC